MKLKFFFPLLVSIVLVENIQAQNLVPNPSFEEYNQCPYNNSYVHYATGWWGVNNTPDYFNSCDTFYPPLTLGVPHNFAGWQMPYEGEAYVGIITRDFFDNYREVIGCALLDTLKAGYTYLLSMRVSRAGGIGMAVCSNNIGMRFSNTAYDAGNPIPIDNYADVKVDSFVIDSTNWVELHWTFSPATSYRYLFIGNFFDDINTDTLHLGTVYPVHAYYYIDNVEVICQSTNCNDGFAIIDDNSIKIIYDPNLNTIHFTGQISNTDRAAIYDCSGKLVRKQSALSSINTSGLPTGIYFLTILGEHFAVHHKLLIQ